jgi:hypothetical protein
MKTEIEPKVKAGDWVCIINHRSKNGFLGFISKIDRESEGYQIIITKDRKGRKTPNLLIWVDLEQLVPILEYKDEDDLLALIDLALDLNDKEWFMELTEQLPLVNF